MVTIMLRPLCPTGNKAGTQGIVGWMVPRAGQDVYEEKRKISCPYRGSNHGSTSSWRSRYTDCVIRDLLYICVKIINL